MSRTVATARAIPVTEYLPVDADWRRIGDSTLNWYYPGSSGELSLGAAQVPMLSNALQPRHRHVFEQLRFVTSGSITFGRNKKAVAGDCVYFPESVPYGPVQYEDGEMYVLQWPGPSEGGQFIDYQEMMVAARELVKGGGEFDKDKGGVFRHPDGRVQDGYEAISEFMNGGPHTYGPKRYADQVLMRTSNFPASDVDRTPGVRIKHLGFFNEMGPNVKLLQFAAGASLSPAIAQSQQVWDVLSGSIIYGGESYPRRSLLYVSPGAERETVRANETTEMLVVHLRPLGASTMPFSEY